MADNCGRVHGSLRSLGNSRRKEAKAELGLARGGRHNRAEVAEEKEELEVRHDVRRRQLAYVPYCPRLYTAASV